MRCTMFFTISGVKPAGSMLLQRVTAIAFASLFFLGAAAKAQEQQDDTQGGQGCTAQILTGGYGYSSSGFSGPYTATTSFFISSAPISPEEAAEVGEGRVGAVGLATFDGAGGLIAQDTLARSGTPAIRHAGAGTYSVNPNCTGHASMDLISAPDSNGKIDSEHFEFDFTIVPGTHGREFSFIVTNQAITNQALCTGAVGDCTPKPTLPEQTGVALSIGDEACSDASLQGTYRLLSTGTNLNNPLKPVANANVGFRTFDGAGNLTDGADTGLANGAILPVTGRTGSYSVQFDCTATEVRNDLAAFDGVVVDGGRQAYFLRTGNFAVTNVFFKKGSGSFVMHTTDTTPPSDASAGDDGDGD